MNDHWYLILNPKAGSGSGEKHWNRISEMLNREGILFEKHVTHSQGHAITLAKQAIHSGFKKIIAIGGDGTANEVANGILSQNEVPSTEIILAQIPVGTGCDWGRTIGIPADYSASIRIIKQEKTIVQDVGIACFMIDGKANERYFVNIAGMGYDAVVGEYVDKLKKSGKGGPLSYLFGLVICLYRYESISCAYGTEAPEFEKEIFSLAVGICKYNGGGMLQCPQAIVDDGLLDMTVIHKLSRWKVIKNIKRLFDGSFTRNSEVAQFRGKQFSVVPKQKMLVEADGEFLGEGPAEFKIQPLRLRVAVK